MKKQNVLCNRPDRKVRPLFARLFLGLILVQLTACSTPGNNSQSSQTTQNGRAQFDQADTNHDGQLSLTEANAFLVNRIFDSLDTNHDGKLSATEATGTDSGAITDFKKRDANHDGYVTKEEALAYGLKHGLAKKAIDEADTNHDGKLSWEEVKAYYADREGPPR